MCVDIVFSLFDRLFRQEYLNTVYDAALFYAYAKARLMSVLIVAHDILSEGRGLSQNDGSQVSFQLYDPLHTSPTV